jgi:hypothetical protein
MSEKDLSFAMILLEGSLVTSTDKSTVGKIRREPSLAGGVSNIHK